MSTTSSEISAAEVKYWLTINEPTDYVMQGYINGEWPPFLKSAWIKAAVVFRNLARAHVAAYRVLHRNRPDVMVGFAHNALADRRLATISAEVTGSPPHFVISSGIGPFYISSRLARVDGGKR